MATNIKFETALSELETVIAKLEDSNTPLDEALKLYEKGISLVRICNERLESAEQKIKILQSKDGQIVETDFIGEQK
ncbi:MAG: exodeoxyribonuclease VII small subunit [Ruminococcaceae bacterium]|nr:exodeoxyribonuclease VII small subunit [Oscillospiraceae bacterium]